MKFVLVIWFIIGIVFALARPMGADTFIYQRMMHTDTFLPTEGYISCTCADGNRKVDLPRNNMNQVFLGIITGKRCDKNYSDEICNLLMYCHGCYGMMSTCNSSLTNDYICFRKEFSMEGSHFHPSISGGLVRHVRRAPEFVGKCAFPISMKTSSLYCKEYPSSMKCIQKCVFGHTLNQGITTEISCDFKENVWKPLGFQECSPFVDCTLTLVTGGSTSCLTPTIYNPPQCNVSCHKYEDKPEISPTFYKCTISGSWDKKLPHCVEPVSGYYLAPAPRNKLHPQPRAFNLTKQPKKTI